MRLLLVEDEPYTRDGIKRSIDWNHFGIDDVICAEDGMAGLKLATKYSPDIVLTDMRTPRMNGANMAEEIHRILPECAFIFMSGYNDIDYYKSAIHVSAFEYIEKPLIMEKLQAALSKTCAHIEKNKTSVEYLTLSRNRELASLLVHPQADESDLDRLWEMNNLPSEKIKMACLLLVHKSSLEIPKLIKRTATKFKVHALSVREDSYYLIHLISGNGGEPPIQSFAKSLIDEAICDKNSKIALGMIISGRGDVNKSYKSAKRALNFSFYNPELRILTDNPEALSLDMGFDPTNEFGQLIINRSDSIPDWINKLFTKIENNQDTPVILVRYWVYRMIEESSFVADKELFQERLTQLNGEDSLWDYISSLKSLYDLWDYMLKAISLFEGFEEEMDNQNISIILAMKRYIQMHHNDPLLSLGEIAEYVNLSPTYLCNIFKETTGETVNQYLNSYRLERAGLYLSTTSMQVKEIAQKAGYSNCSYFIKLFKKNIGQTPQEFRYNHQYL